MTISCLLIEDHAISREFLTQALQSYPCEVKDCEDLKSALNLMQIHHFELWVCDMHLPDAHGPDILYRLRESAPPHAKDTKAVAITADLPQDVETELLAAGFSAVICKPMSIAQLHAALRNIGIPAFHRLNTENDLMWDQGAGLRAVGGNQTTLDALREMFIKELPLQIDTIKQAFEAENISLIKSELHKLMAGCGFVGAANLQATVSALSKSPYDRGSLDSFLSCAQQYLSSKKS